MVVWYCVYEYYKQFLNVDLFYKEVIQMLNNTVYTAYNTEYLYSAVRP